MIKCSLRDLDGRYGRYHRSNFWDVKDFGKKKWVIAAYIDLKTGDLPPWIGEEEIVEECVQYLNTPPERRKYEKKQTESLYGSLEVYQYVFKENEEGRAYIEALLITNQKANKHFWGKGTSDKF